MKKYFMVLVVFMLINKLNAQSKILDTYIKEGLENSLAIKQENLEIEKTLLAIEIAKANYQPRFVFSPTYTLAAGGRKLNFPIGDLLNPVYNTLNALTNSKNFPNVENVNEQLAPNNFHETKINFQYPIFSPEIKYGIEIQKSLAQTAAAKKSIVSYELEQAINQAYIQYLLTEKVIKIYKNAETLLKEVEVFNQKLVANDAALKDAVLSAQFDIAKINQEINTAEKNIKLAKAYFNFILSKPLDSEVLIDTNLVNSASLNLQNLDFYNQSALDKRKEFNQLDAALNTSEALIKFNQKTAKLPQVFLGGNLGFQGFGYKFVDQGYGLVQIGLNYELYHGKEKKKKIEQAVVSKQILDLKKQELKKQVEIQVKQAFLETENALSSLSTFSVSKEKASKIRDIVKVRYTNGKALYIELSKAQNDLIQTQLTEEAAINEFFHKKAILKKVSALSNLIE